MLLTQPQFEQRFKNKALKIAFIGMSNVGKSHAGRLLKTHYDFDLYEVDAHIQKAMELQDIKEASNWMGYPFEAKYPENEKYYLDLEEKYTYIQNFPDNNFVLDTTGSVIYLTKEIHDWLKANFLVVSFDVGENMIETMKKDFFTHPKPVIWKEDFNQQESEAPMDALRRCYPQLLTNRIKRYRALADVIIPGEFSKYKGLSAQRLLEVLRLSLPKNTPS